VKAVAWRLASDPLLRAQLLELLSQAQARQNKSRRRKLAKLVLLGGGGVLAVAAVPAARERMRSLMRNPDDSLPASWPAPPQQPPPDTID
jgi:hypothetical protein